VLKDVVRASMHRHRSCDQCGHIAGAQTSLLIQNRDFFACKCRSTTGVGGVPFYLAAPANISTPGDRDRLRSTQAPYTLFPRTDVERMNPTG